jgi:cation-transporting P-type ATPase E
VTSTTDDPVKGQHTYLPRRRPSRRDITVAALAAGATALAAGVAAVLAWRGWLNREPPALPAPPAEEYRGLSRAEANARLAQFPAPPPKEQGKQLLKEFLKRNTFTIFNLNMIVLAVLYWLLDNYVGALLLVLLLLISSFLRALMQIQAVRNKKILEEVTAPRATVIRDGLPFDVPFNQVFEGDLVALGPGDQVPASGEILSDVSLVVETSAGEGQEGRVSLRRGDTVYTGSYCVSGRATMCAASDGIAAAADLSAMMAGLTRRHQTPLQRTMDRVFVALLGLVLFLTALMLLDAWQSGAELQSQYYWSMSAIIFSLAPSGIYFCVVMGYIGGMIRVGRTGGLVGSTESLEDLSTCDVLCFGDTPALNGVQIAIKPFVSADAAAAPVQQLISILGDWARSMTSKVALFDALSDNFQGSTRRTIDRAPFLSVNGWMAATFNDDDLRGVYVIGDAEALRPYLPSGDLPEATDVTPVLKPDPMLVVAGRLAAPFRRAAGRLRRGMRRQPPPPPPAPVEQKMEQPYLILAHSPVVALLHDEEGKAVLPEQLTPLAKLEFSSELRAGALDALKAVEETGVSLCFLKRRQPGAGSQAAEASRADSNLGVTRGEERRRAVLDLKGRRHDVIMVGDATADIGAMRGASVTISTPAATQAALGLADIVLLRRSLDDVMAVVAQGQRSVRYVIDALNIFFPQIVRILILFAANLWAGVTFPYASVHSGVFATFNQAIPFMVLPFTAPAGRLSKESLRRQFLRFALPPGLLQAMLALVVYDYFINAGADVTYTQMAVTYAVVFSGLLLLMFVRPIIPLFAGGTHVVKDRSATYLALILFVFILIACDWRLAELIFQMKPLSSRQDWIIVFAAAVIWGIAVQVVWRVVTVIERLVSKLYTRLRAARAVPLHSEASPAAT